MWGCAAPVTEPKPSASVAAVKVIASHDWAEDAAWRTYHSKRFFLTIPLPDGESWRIDDHSRPALFALHSATNTRLTVIATKEDELVNRAKCEARARSLGWVADARLSTVEDDVVVGPGAYDSRVWVALDARLNASVEGHIYLFGALLRRCLLIHLSTSVASAKDEEVLSERLALARARIIGALSLDAPRTLEQASVPREVPTVSGK